VLPANEAGRLLAAVAAAVDFVLGERKRRIAGQLTGRAVTRERRRIVRIDEARFEIEVERGKPGEPIAVTFFEDDGGKSRAHTLESAWRPGDRVWTGKHDGKTIAARVRPIRNGFEISSHGAKARCFVYTRSEAMLAQLMPAKAAADTGKLVRCPMPGLVLAIAVAAGQEVKAGEPLAVVEAMKMENVLRAERDGRVKVVRVKPGDSLAVDAVILEFE
jgi:propionyl-CoA carboxylase alpha chain